MKKTLRKLTALGLLFLLCFAQQGRILAYADPVAEAAGTAEEKPETAAAGDKIEWPQLNAGIVAGSAIVMDADTRQILWGKEIHAKRYPASITKLLTALVVLDHCSLDEQVTFSASAVSNLESGAVTIGAQAGDTLSVKDCLYAMLLKSANEVANALAEHVAGSQESFAEMMNAKARELGCVDSDFHNPSGLTDSNHVTSAYDMALIGCACMNSMDFLALESEPKRKLSPTAKYPDGLTVTIGHKMRLEGETYYDARVIAGKTGFTTASGNTLVTMAEDHGRKVVAVVLKDNNPGHYTDTKALIDFGLERFELVRPDPASLIETKEIEQTLVQKGLIPAADELTGAYNEIRLSGTPVLTVPAGAGEENVRLEYETVPGKEAPEGAVAKAELVCSDSVGPPFYIISTRIEVESENAEVILEDGNGGPGKTGEEETSGKGGISMLAWILIALLLTVLIFATYLFIRRYLERKRRATRRRIRRERMERLENSQNETAGAPVRQQKDGRSSEIPAGPSEHRSRRRGSSVPFSAKGERRRSRTENGGRTASRSTVQRSAGRDPGEQSAVETEEL